MTAFALACVVFAAGCFAALALRGTGLVRRDGLFGVLMPMLIASIAGGLYAWYAIPNPQGEPAQSEAAAAPHGGDELQNLANQMRAKLGAEPPAASAPPAVRPAGDLHDLAKQLAAKLERDPGNAQGWALLARSYANIQQFGDAEKAFEKAAKLLPRDAQLLADWAEARVVGQGGKWDARAQQLLKQALAADPRNPKAVSLSGEAMRGR
jgi:cytochrome c-type biogenesis protein CcmH/NrfG